MLRNFFYLTLSLAIASAVAASFDARAGTCKSLFTSNVRKPLGPVRIAFKSGDAVPFSLQHELLALSEADARSVTGRRVFMDFVRNSPIGRRHILVFTGLTDIVELSIFHSPEGNWSISSVAKSTMSGRTRNLAAGIAPGGLADIEKLDSFLAAHLRATRDVFMVASAVKRDDLIRPILNWAKASGENLFTGNLVELFLASRREVFHLDRGFEKDAAPVLSESDRKKIAAVSFLVEKHLTFALGSRDVPSGIFRQVGQDGWMRVSSSDDQTSRDATALLFQAMTNAGFLYDSGVYR
jgi:hypothetical protein